jgi:hypothetical protein
VYGLAGGKRGEREKRGSRSSLDSDLPDPKSFLQPPPPAVPIRGSGLPLPSVAESAKGIKPDPGIVFDVAEMNRRNQEMIASMARRKAGMG